MRGHGRGRRGSGRAAVNRAHSRPPGAARPAAEAGARVAGALAGLLAHQGVTVAAIAQALGVREIDVVRWRRGQPIPSYRRAEVEGRLARLRVVPDEETGRSRLELPGEESAPPPPA